MVTPDELFSFAPSGFLNVSGLGLNILFLSFIEHPDPGLFFKNPVRILKLHYMY